MHPGRKPCEHEDDHGQAERQPRGRRSSLPRQEPTLPHSDLGLRPPRCQGKHLLFELPGDREPLFKGVRWEFRSAVGFPGSRKTAGFSGSVERQELSRQGTCTGNIPDGSAGPAPLGPFPGSQGPFPQHPTSCQTPHGQTQLKPRGFSPNETDVPLHQESRSQALLSDEIRKGRCQEERPSWPPGRRAVHV